MATDGTGVQGVIEYLPDCTPPAPGTTRELLPGLHWVRMPLPSALQHINLWLLDDGAAWTLVDCGIGTDTLQQWWRQILAGTLGGRPVAAVVATHLHSDHLGLAAWLCERLRAPLLMSAGDFGLAQRMRGATAAAYGEQAAAHLARHGVTDAAALAAVRAQPSPYPELVPALPPLARPLADGDVLRFGGHDWAAVAGRGHSPEHLAFHCEALNVLIAGDMLLPRISTYVGVSAMEPEANPLPDFLASIDRFLALPDDTLVLPSHGEPFRGIRARVAALHAHHRQRLQQVLAACATPRSAAEVVPLLFRRTLDARQHALALGETVAHLHALEGERLLQRATQPAGVIRYVAAGH